MPNPYKPSADPRVIADQAAEQRRQAPNVVVHPTPNPLKPTTGEDIKRLPVPAAPARDTRGPALPPPPPPRSMPGPAPGNGGTDSGNPVDAADGPAPAPAGRETDGLRVLTPQGREVVPWPAPRPSSSRKLTSRRSAASSRTRESARRRPRRFEPPRRRRTQRPPRSIRRASRRAPPTPATTGWSMTRTGTRPACSTRRARWTRRPRSMAPTPREVAEREGHVQTGERALELSRQPRGGPSR